jgi:glyoxylase-like metal-dependent hydrolase (beta-lactamase superfamily II)
VWIHEAERDAAPFATDVIRGLDETKIAPGLLAFPVPGHTEGSVLYLHDERHVFSGDTVAWIWRTSDLGAFRGATWHSWDALRESLHRFVESGHRFEWICPGHGTWHGAPAEEMHRRLATLVARM